MAGGLRASGPKADLALVAADGEAAAAGVFTTNIVCAAPVTYCRAVLAKRETVRAVRGPRALAPQRRSRPRAVDSIHVGMSSAPHRLGLTSAL
jgi:hypothetical protein